jgi:hypothetical protein
MAAEKQSMTTTTDTTLGRSSAGRLRHRYISRRGESNAVQLAYDGWVNSHDDKRELAYAGYLAALDQEALAADSYRDELAWAARISG